MRCALSHLRPAVAALAMAGLISAAPPAVASAETPGELRSRIERLQSELAEAQAALARATESTTPPEAAVAPATPVPPSVQQANAADSPSSKATSTKANAANRFLDVLIVISFLAVAVSFIAARYRDSQNPAEAAPVTTSSSSPPASTGVVFFSRNDETQPQAPAETKQEAEENTSPEALANPEVEALPNQVSGDVAPGSTNAPIHAPEGFEMSAEAESLKTEAPDLRVEPKRKSRGKPQK